MKRPERGGASGSTLRWMRPKGGNLYVAGRLARRFVAFAVALLASFSLFSCSQINCQSQNTVAVNYEFRQPINAYGDTREDTLAVGDTLWIATQRADGVDTVLFNSGIRTTTFTLPISNSHPEDMLLFVVKDQTGYLFDTIWVAKEDFPHFESVDCGATFFHNITSVRSTHKRIDSVVVHTPQVNYDLTPTHIYIYLRKP